MNLSLRRDAHRFGYQRVLEDIDLTIAAGEAVATLGQVLATAHADNLPPHARARSAGSAS